jgi:hypothetical protein
VDAGKRSELRTWAVVLVAVGALIVAGAWFGLPLLQDGASALNTGVTLKTAALWSFGVTVALLIVFAVAAGDSLIGELQFMLAGFFVFFVIITLLIAWIF